MNTSATSATVYCPQGKQGYRTSQAARILKCRPEDIYDMISRDEVRSTSDPKTGVITIFLVPPQTTGPVSRKPNTKSAVNKGPTLIQNQSTTYTEPDRVSFFSDRYVRVRVPPGRFRPIREPEPAPMIVEFPPPLVSEIPDGWMSLREAAGLLRVSMRNTKRFGRENRLESKFDINLGRTLVSRDSVRKHLEQFE